MRYKVFSLMIAALLLMTLLPGCTLDDRLDAAEDRIETQMDLLEDKVENRLESSPTPAANNITQAEAEEIALNNAGFTADQVQRLRTEYEIDDRIPQYDVEFYVNNVEYEFEIHAETGEIISFDKDTQ